MTNTIVKNLAGTKTEQRTWMIGTPRSRWKTHVGSARASVGCRAPPSLLHQGDRLNNYISLKVVTQCSSISVRSQTTPLSWSLFGTPWCLEDRSSPRRSSDRTEIENSNHFSAFFCPLSENHVILTHQFPSCDIIESDTVTVKSKWHRLCDDCRLMLMFVCPAHLFMLVSRSNCSQNHMKTLVRLNIFVIHLW